MSSDYEFSDEEEYNEYDDDEAMNIEGGMSFPSLICLHNLMIWLPLLNDRLCLIGGGHGNGRLR